jgi:PAS domain S-box-containing protein
MSQRIDELKAHLRSLETGGLDRFTRFAVEHLSEPLYWIDEDGDIIYANVAACNLVGYEIEQLRSMKMYEINVDLDASNWPAIWGLLKAAGRRTFEARHRRKDGKLLEVEVTAHFLCLDDKEYSCAFIRENGAQKALDRRLRQAEKMEAVGRLAGGVAHDFNNQLAALLGYTEVIRAKARDNPVVLELLDQQRHVVEVAADLTSQLLAFSRPGKVVTDPVDLHALLRSVVAILSRSIDKQIRIEVALEAERYWTFGDTSQLQSALLNLLLNARDAMPNGGTIRLTTANVMYENAAVGDFPSGLAAGEYVMVSVSDTGVGIKPDALERVFEPFFTTKDVGVGMGLGLAVVYGTLKNHRGAVGVSSEIGKGSVFSLYLPASRAPKGTRVLREEPASLRLQGHVLLIDDEAAVRDATAKMLQSLGCTVASFSDGDSAIEHFKLEHLSVDVVLLDLMMPGLPSIETLAALQRIDPGVQVLLASGYSEHGQAQAMLGMGAKAFMRKPFSMAALAGQVGALLPRRAGV